MRLPALADEQPEHDLAQTALFIWMEFQKLYPYRFRPD